MIMIILWVWDNFGLIIILIILIFFFSLSYGVSLDKIILGDRGGGNIL